MSHRSLDNKQIEEVCEKYISGKNTHELSLEYNCSNVTIKNWLVRSNIALRRGHECRVFGKLNEHVFDEINEKSAYWIGYLLADGCIIYKYEIWPMIQLSSNDGEHIYKFKDFLECKNTIYKSFNKEKIHYTINVRSPLMVNTLESYGVVRKKSLIATVSPTLSQNKDFWRGYVDGNGCLFYDVKSKLAGINLCGTENIILNFYLYCLSICSFKAKPRKTGNVYQIHIYGKAARLIIQNLYQNSNIFLDRKMNKAIVLCGDTFNDQ